jgi:acyl transferase domain-containing protein/NADPH:quinone reductase-like Zn-dependent oxidoreductase
MAWRSSFIAGSHQDLVASLESKADCSKPIVKSSSSHRIAFIFTGQGAQWVGMGRELIHTNSAFSASIRESDRTLRELGASWSLIDELLSEQSKSRINESEIAQPTSTALQIALVNLLSSFGVTPQMVLGHSSGEIASAYSAGILSHTEALKVSYHRSFIAKHCKSCIPTNGAMLAVGLGEEQISPLLARAKNGTASLACINSPSSTTVSGDEDAILEIQEILDNSGTFNRRLITDTAYHSHHMRKVAGKYLSSMGSIPTLPSRGIQFISSVMAKEKVIGFGSDYWVENLVSPVRFSEALEHYCTIRHEEDELSGDSSNLILVEIGPHSVLKGPIRQTITSKFGDSFRHVYLPSLVRGRNATYSILELVGNLFEQGCPVDVDAANSIVRNHFPKPSFLPGLPNYPWDHSNTYWHESRLSKQYRQRKYPYHDLLGVRVVSSTSLEPVWTHIIGLERLPWLADHVVDGLVIFPGSGYICMAVEAIHQHIQESQVLGNISTFILQDITISKALVIPSPPSKVETQLSLRTQRNSGKIWHEFRVSALSDGEIWYEHCRGLVRVEYSVEPSDSAVPLSSRIELDAHCQTMDSDSIYAEMRSNGNLYGPCFTAIRKLKMSGLKAISYIEIPDVQSRMPANYMQPHIIHPTTLDTLLHTSLPIFSSVYGPGSVMPVSIGKIVLHRDINNKPRDELISHTVLSPKGKMLASASLLIFNGDASEHERPLLEISEVEIRGFGETDDIKIDLQRNFSYRMEWAADIEHSLRGDPSISLSEYLNHLHFKYSSLKILKVNSGSRQLTGSTISALAGFPNGGIESFDFADASDECFKDVQDALSDGSQTSQVNVINIGSEPVDQSLISPSYDLIILTMDDLDHVSETISHAQKLLNHGGWLMLCANINLAQSKDELRSRLLQNSFDGVKLLLTDDDMTKTAVVVSKPAMPDSRYLIPPIHVTGNDGTKDLAHELCISLRKSGFDAVSREWDATVEESEVIHVVVDNGQNPFLVNPSAKQFRELVDLVSGAKANVLWISAQQDFSATINPEKGLIIGFARSACAENEHLKFVTLDVQDVVTSHSLGLLDAIEKILITFFEPSSPGKIFEKEYAYRDGNFLIPRLIPDPSINSWIARTTGKSTVSTVAYSNPDRPLKLDMETANLGESLYFVDDEPCCETIGASEVDIVVKAHTLCLDDNKGSLLNTSINQIPKKIREFSGVVSRISKESANELRVGDRVCGWIYDTKAYASLVRTNLENVLLLPTEISFRTGSTIPFSFMIAYYSLVELARLRKGQTLLIHNAAGDIGRAALILAREIKAGIFATVLNAEDKERITQDFDLRPEHVLYEHATNLEQKISQLTNKAGVDAILNLALNDCNPDSPACIAAFGMYIHAGQPDNQDPSFENRTFTYRLERNATFVSFDLDTLIRLRPEKAANLLRRATASLNLSEELLDSQNNTSVSPGGLHDALRLLSSHKHPGKIILETGLDSRVKVLNKKLMGNSGKQDLDPNATYVIAGGLGDLGKRMCDLMARRGARHIALLSRKPANPETMKSLKNRLQQLSPGCSVYSFACDISSLSMVQEAATAIGNAGLPPVRGVIQSATVLEVSPHCLIYFP